MVTLHEFNKLEQELIQTKEHFFHVIDRAIIAICITDYTGKFVYVNQQYCKFYGYKAQELLGKHFTVIVPEKNIEVLTRLHDEFIAGTKEPRGEWEVVTRSGEIRTILADAARITDDQGNPQKVTYIMDITDRKHQEQEIQRAYALIREDTEKANRILQQFMPHNLRPQYGLNFAFYNQPAEHIGGDFGNVKRIDNKRMLLYMVDVSGHGLDAALLNIFVKNTIEHFLSLHSVTAFTPTDILKYVHKRFTEEQFPEEYFICMVVAIYDYETKGMDIGNAGIQVPIYQIENAKVKPIVIKGMPVSSIIPEQIISFGESRLELQQNNKLVFTTDGLIELNNDAEIYGYQKFEQIITRPSESLQELIDSIVYDYTSFTASKKVDDDITILAIERID